MPDGHDIHLAKISSILEQSLKTFIYRFNLTYLNTKEILFHFDYLSRFAEKQFYLARQDLQNLRTDISETLMKNDSFERNQLGVPLIAIGALTAVTPGAGTACPIGSIFGACDGSTKNRDNIYFALQKPEENENLWIEVQSKLNGKFYKVTSQLKFSVAMEKFSKQT